MSNADEQQSNDVTHVNNNCHRKRIKPHNNRMRNDHKYNLYISLLGVHANWITHFGKFHSPFSLFLCFSFAMTYRNVFFLFMCSSRNRWTFKKWRTTEKQNMLSFPPRDIKLIDVGGLSVICTYSCLLKHVSCRFQLYRYIF